MENKGVQKVALKGEGKVTYNVEMWDGVARKFNPTETEKKEDELVFLGEFEITTNKAYTEVIDFLNFHFEIEKTFKVFKEKDKGFERLGVHKSEQEARVEALSSGDGKYRVVGKRRTLEIGVKNGKGEILND